MADFISTSDDGPVRTLTMSNPGSKNAVPSSGWVELADAFSEFESSDQRALVVGGADGDFCAGADLSRTPRPSLSTVCRSQRWQQSTVWLLVQG